MYSRLVEKLTLNKKKVTCKNCLNLINKLKGEK